VYLDFDYEAIENNWSVSTFGNKFLLKMEERNRHPNQYDILTTAKIRTPKQFKNPKNIDRLCLVKISERERKFERAFFMVGSYEEFEHKSSDMIKIGKITKKSLQTVVIEEFVVGAQVNFNFFYSRVNERLELLGTDTRRQTNLDGLLHLPSNAQQEVFKNVLISYEEAGHVAVTVIESLLEGAFAIAERFVKASQKLSPPGIIGPFSLQSMITPGPPKKDIVVFDVSPRMPGSPGISATPYSGYLFGESISVGRRVAMEIKEAYNNHQLSSITS
jgi:5-formaminoimidazole-4-carboxamide-1-(beta)-D-ribofuranosyl 5'-monophosphate synthetase